MRAHSLVVQVKDVAKPASRSHCRIKVDVNFSPAFTTEDRLICTLNPKRNQREVRLRTQVLLPDRCKPVNQWDPEDAGNLKTDLPLQLLRSIRYQKSICANCSWLPHFEREYTVGKGLKLPRRLRLTLKTHLLCSKFYCRPTFPKQEACK